MWAVLSVGTGVTAPSRVERLKLRRAIDGLRAIQQDLAGRPATARYAEHAELLQLTRSLTEQLETPR
jgi:hypothetical protein